MLDQNGHAEDGAGADMAARTADRAMPDPAPSPSGDPLFRRIIGRRADRTAESRRGFLRLISQHRGMAARS